MLANDLSRVARSSALCLSLAVSILGWLPAGQARAEGTVQLALFPAAASDTTVQALADALGTSLIEALKSYPEMAIAARPALDLPTMQLALGCDDSSDECLRAAIALAHTQALLAPAVTPIDGGGTVVTLLYFDVIEGVSRTVERRHPADQTQAGIIDTVPDMLAEALQRSPIAPDAVAQQTAPRGEPQDVPGEVSVELPVEPTAKSSSLPVLPLTLSLTGAALIGGGIVFGILANHSESEFGALPVGSQKEADAAADKLDEAKTQATLANIGFGVGAAALAAGITLWVLDSRSTVESQAGTVSLTPSLGSQGGGLVLHGRW